MNMSAGQSFELEVPDHERTVRELATAKPVAAGTTLKVGPRSTVVLHFK
jgi:hypothetical protein